MQAMYLNKRSIPGDYELTIHHHFHSKENKQPFPVYLTITKNFNRENETVEKVKVWIDPLNSGITKAKTFTWSIEE